MTAPIADIAARLTEAGWLTIDSAPTDGTRIRVGHLLDPSSVKLAGICPVTGRYEAGEWVCNAGFVCVDGMFRFKPTHWLPAYLMGAVA